MTISRNFKDYSKDELLKALNELQLQFNLLESTILKRKQTEEDLLASEEKFRKAFLTSPDSVNINRLEDGMYMLINKGFTKITGYSEEEVIGKTSLELNIWTNPNDRVTLITGLKEKGEVENLETTFMMKNGSVRNGIMSATIIDLEGIPHILSITRDITDRKYAEIALKVSENKYRELIELAVDGILTESSDGTIIGANSYMLTLTGRSLDNILGMHISELFSNDSLIDSPLRSDLLQKGETVINERDIIRPDRIQVPIEMHTKLMPDGTYQSIFRDISKRKLADELLRENQQMLQNVLSNFPGVVFWKDKQSNYLGCNQSFAVGAGLKSPVEIIGKTDFELPWGTTEAVDYRNDDQMVIDSGKPKLHIIEMQHQIDGCVIWLDTNKIPLRDSNGEIIGIMGVSADITDLKLVEDSLKESEEKLKSIFSAAPVGIGLVINRILMEVNDSLCRLIGYDRNELIGKSAEILYPSKDEYDRVGKEKYSQIIDLGTGSIETIFKCKDGNIINVILSSTPLDKNDHSKGVTFTVLDITERNKIEIALRESEEKFRSIAENLSDVIFLTDLEGIVKYISPSVKSFGYDAEECVGIFFGDFLGEGELEKAMTIFIDTINKKVTSNSTSLQIRRKNGSVFFAELSGSVFNVENEAAGILGLLRDVTQRKILESATVESEKRYRELFFNNPVPTYIFDTVSFEFVEVNDAMVENYGYSREEFALMTLRDIRIPEEVDDMIKSVREMGKKAFHSTSMYHRKKDGTVFPVEITSHYLTEKNGRETRLVLVIDISERVKAAEHMKLAMEKAEASDKLKTSFLNNISHEVRTPLNGILGFAEIMSQTDLSKEEIKDSLYMLHESSNRLLDTITNYMDISLLTSGNMTVRNKDFVPVQELKRIYDFYKTICSERNLNFCLEIPEQADHIFVNSDPEIFNKILTQLLSNAIKFTEKGSIIIGFEKYDDKLEFFVKDTGIGIDKDLLKNIFDRFVKLEMNPAIQTEGSGLGLAIAKGMINILGGDIRVESELKVGSEFTFTIPFINGEVISSGVGTGMGKKRTLSRSKIMIAEDDEINLFYLNALLTQETGSEIIHARNGKEAIDLFQNNPGINLILMDIKMPEIDGLEATRQIKLLKAAVPVIAITAYAMSGDEERVLAAGCDGYLSKPINKKSLLDKIGEFVNLR